ncbi:MAG: hypothetical protein J7578_19825 [Chitinophagaceae bacterium]|nr:hypothetical protein [Chitinophagaceae bacterium]
MRKLFFFIFLFTLLLRGVDQVYAGKLVHTTCFLAEQEFRKMQRGKGNDQGESHLSFTATDSKEVQQGLVFEEIDDQTNNDYARKYKLLTGYLPILTHTFYQNHIYGCLKDRLPACSYLSCKYITQRALRI